MALPFPPPIVPPSRPALPVPCLKIPIPPIPTLPPGLTLGVPIPVVSFDPALCCKILPFPLVTPPIPLPPLVLNPAVIAIINEKLTALNAYFDQLTIDCLLESSVL
jgi:hypothetical protein